MKGVVIEGNKSIVIYEGEKTDIVYKVQMYERDNSFKNLNDLRIILNELSKKQLTQEQKTSLDTFQNFIGGFIVTIDNKLKIQTINNVDFSEIFENINFYDKEREEKRINDEKYVAYVIAFHMTEVKYYEYKNIFVSGSKVKIIEYYGKGGFDPLDSKNGYVHNVESVDYYE
jgi:hypothetical protein